MKLFERFDNVFCINLDRRTDRLESFTRQVNKYDLGSFTRVSAIDGRDISKNQPSNKINPGCLGLIVTVEQIILSSITKNYNSILIVEDDCVFTDEVRNIDKYFDKLPNDWDLLYFGGNHNLHMGQAQPKIINDKVWKLHNTYTTHFVGIKSQMFQTILSSISNKLEPLDVTYSRLQKKHIAYSFYPAIAKQLHDFSDIENKIINYDWLIK